MKTTEAYIDPFVPTLFKNSFGQKWRKMKKKNVTGFMKQNLGI